MSGCAASFEKYIVQAIALHRHEQHGDATTTTSPEEVVSLMDNLNEETPLGSGLRPLFPIGAKNRSVNFGSYGNPPLPIVARRLYHMTETIDTDTDTFFRVTGEPLLQEVRACLAEFVGLDKENNADDIFLVDNAADGFNVVASSMIFNAQFHKMFFKNNCGGGEGIPGTTRPHRLLLLNRAYPMIKTTVQFHNDRAQVVADRMFEAVPSMSKEQAAALAGVVEVVEFKVLDEHVQNDDAFVKDIVDFAVEHQVSFVVFDHIGFSPAWLLPIGRLAREIKKARGGERSVHVTIDAAHAIGNLNLQFGASQYKFEEEDKTTTAAATPYNPLCDLAFDAWFSNCHKWLAAPKHSAVLIVKPQLQQYLHPVCISNFYVDDDTKASFSTAAIGDMDILTPVAKKKLHTEFFWRGTRDVTNFLVLKDLIEFRAKLGESRIQAYNRETCLQGAKEAAKIWGTNVLLRDNATKEPRTDCSIVCVELPAACKTNAMAFQTVSKILSEHHSFAPSVDFNGTLYARFSCQMYNCVDDFVYFAKTFAEVLKTISDA